MYDVDLCRPVEQGINQRQSDGLCLGTGRNGTEESILSGRFCEASARYIFGDTVGDPAADTILRALKGAGTNGLSRTDIYKLFGCNLAAGKIDASLILLLNTGKARRTSTKGAAGGKRPIEMWFAV